MKNILLTLLLIGSSAPLLAHPMGNFSINHYSAISIQTDGIHVEYIIDMAEIPAFQEMQHANADGDGVISAEEANLFSSRISEQFRLNLGLFVNEHRLRLTPTGNRMKVVPGAGGLPTFVITSGYLAKWNEGNEFFEKANSVKYVDENYPERIGWKEIVVKRNSAMPVLNLPPDSFKDRSKQLTEYPADPAKSPPGETSVAFAFSNAVFSPQVEANPGESSSLVQPSPLRREDRFTQLIHAKELSRDVVLFSLLVAFVLGAFHALSPGHGKAIVAGYLVGSRGTVSHAVFLGAVVTFTHTVGVFALGLITLFGSKYILPEKLYPWVGFISGISITWIGASLLRKSWLRNRKHHSHNPGHHHDHDHDDHNQGHDHHHHHPQDRSHDHPHDRSHDHSHLPVDQHTGSITWRSLLTVGISGGALPCPSALVVLLSAIALHRIAFGLLLIVAFSLGLAVVLTCAGLVFVYFSRLSERFPLGGGRLIQQLPMASSLVISVLGFIIAIRSIIQA